MKNTALTRSIPYWLLLVLSLAAIGVGGWIATDQIGVMTTALLDGTATGVEVYAGQSWVTLGAAIAGAGVVGLFLALALAAAKALVGRRGVEVVEAIDWSADADTAPDAAEDTAEDTAEENSTETTVEGDGTAIAETAESDEVVSTR